MKHEIEIPLKLSEWPGVGAKLLERLAQLNIFSVEDLLFHLPYRYEDQTHFAHLDGRYMDQQVLIQGTVRHAKVTYGKRRQLLCEIDTPSGLLQCRFFHFQDYQRQQLNRQGAQVVCFGQLRFFSGQWTMVHPRYHILKSDEVFELSQYYTPVYGVCSGLSSARLEKLIHQALTLLAREDFLQEILPEVDAVIPSWVSLKEALNLVHRPPKHLDLNDLQLYQHPSQQRLAFEELLARQLILLQGRDEHAGYRSFSLKTTKAIFNDFLATLPFKLTGAQRRVLDEIIQDLSSETPMLRLLQGDVGCGKTLVAAISMLVAHTSGQQSALMVPTELLAQQHFEKLSALMKPMNIEVGCLLGRHTAKQRVDVLEGLKSGELTMVVGTHTLFQKQVEFHALSLTVIDEQHRFGVDQRLSFWKKSEAGAHRAHQLFMTATPIPRTLAMTMYAHLDISVIDELPPNRQPIGTRVMDLSRLDELVEGVVRSVESGVQVYWVCTRIESDDEGVAACEMRWMDLKNRLGNISLAMIHGKMPGDEKSQVMQDFSEGKVNVLVATTVIEVGVDVPNANLMVIENAERLGLAQLHQLRGRVGRSNVQAHCILLYQGPLSQVGQQRLSIMRDTQDGFEIARSDLSMRGPGEVLGVQQSGEAHLRLGHIIGSEEMLEKAYAMAHDWKSKGDSRVDVLINRWMSGLGQYQKA